MKVIKDLRRQVTRNLKKMIQPHLWKSGYGSTNRGTTAWEALLIFVFALKEDEDGKDVGLKFNAHFEGTGIQGFYSDGVVDALGGGCGLHPFSSFAVEDLLAMEKWMMKNFEKEIDKAVEKYRKEK